MTVAAVDHCRDAGRKGSVSHRGSDWSNYSQRIARYGRTEGFQAENISVGSKDPVKIIMELFIEGGSKRAALMNKNFRVTGITLCKHAS